MRRMPGSDGEFTNSDKDMDVNGEAPPHSGATGLALAERCFGPLLSPVAATPAQWTAYTEHRQGTNAEFRNVFDCRKRSISDTIAEIEEDLGLNNGTLQKCISVIWRIVERDGVEVSGVCASLILLPNSQTLSSQPRNADILVRIYSPAAPKYIDVHVKYHYLSRMSEVEWHYSIGYKIYNRISGSPSVYHDPPTNGPPSMWHSRAGWQPICWGYYDDDGNYGHTWRHVEVADMELNEEGVLDIHEALFAPIDTPPGDNADALLAFRRKLVVTVRLLLAAVGIDYEVACTDEETDERPGDYMLEGLWDKWVARGIREACGFQLSGDAEAAKRGNEERKEQAMGEDDEEEDSFSDDEW